MNAQPLQHDHEEPTVHGSIPLDDVDLAIVGHHFEIVVVLSVPSIGNAYHRAFPAFHLKGDGPFVGLVSGVSRYSDFLERHFSRRHESLFLKAAGGRNQIAIRMMNIEQGISNHEIRSRKFSFLHWTFYIRYSAD
jgi:hypothetical protein